MLQFGRLDGEKLSVFYKSRALGCGSRSDIFLPGRALVATRQYQGGKKQTSDSRVELELGTGKLEHFRQLQMIGPPANTAPSRTALRPPVQATMICSGPESLA